jgi:hypothetical protein
VGGVGRCGKEYCCSTWLTELSPVNLALAKDQHLSLNPSQISGGCGRLLCCLKYEHEFYAAQRKRFPREGKTITTLRGAERVVAVDIFRERVFLRGPEESRVVPLADLQDEIARAPAPEAPVAREGTKVASEPARRTPPAPRATRESRPPAEPVAATEPSPSADVAAAADAPGSGPRKKRRRRRRRGPRPEGGEGGAPPSEA